MWFSPVLFQSQYIQLIDEWKKHLSPWVEIIFKSTPQHLFSDFYQRTYTCQHVCNRSEKCRFACCGFSTDKKLHHSCRLFRHLSRHCWCKTAPQPNTSVFTACFNIPLTPIKIWASDNLLSCISYHHYVEYVAFFACDFLYWETQVQPDSNMIEKAIN